MNKVFILVVIAAAIVTVAGLLLRQPMLQPEIKTQEECELKGGKWQECGPNECQLTGGTICPAVCGPPVCIFER